MSIKEKLDLLYGKDTKETYMILKEIEEYANNTNVSYCYFDEFLNMLINDNSFIRVRGFRLICKNAKWDINNRINESINVILKELYDEKPTAVRQCLNALKSIVIYKKELKVQIKEKLLSINTSQYKESMSGLIEKDIADLLKLINEI